MELLFKKEKLFVHYFFHRFTLIFNNILNNRNNYGPANCQVSVNWNETSFFLEEIIKLK